MAYADRFTVTTKDFGRKVLIKVHRGTVEFTYAGKPRRSPAPFTLTIDYPDDENRGRKLKAK